MKVKLHEGQLSVARDTHRFRTICAGRRWGKSILARLIILKWAIEAPGLYWIVSPTYRQGKQNHWRNLKAEIPKEWITKTNEVELSIQLKNGSIIELKGAENPDNLRGVKLRGLVIDEIASIRNWTWLWLEVLRPTLTDYESPSLFISTPKGYNHFYDLFNLEHKDEQYKSWRFTSYDNPYIPTGEIDKTKYELSEDTFAQEYMADFRKATGLAHKPWDRAIHVIEPFDVPSTWQRARGFDYGSANPTASVRVAIDPDDNWFVESSYKDQKREIEEHANAIKAQDYGFGFVPCWGDPSGSQWFTEFDKYNVHIQPASKDIKQGMRGWVEHCVEKVNSLLMPQPGHIVRLEGREPIENAPKLFVLNTPDNQNFIKEIELLMWRTTADGQTLPVLDEQGDPFPQGHFDLLAAMRYLAVSYKKPPVTRGGLPYDAEHRTFGVYGFEAYQ